MRALIASICLLGVALAALSMALVGKPDSDPSFTPPGPRPVLVEKPASDPEITQALRLIATRLGCLSNDLQGIETTLRQSESVSAIRDLQAGLESGLCMITRRLDENGDDGGPVTVILQCSCDGSSGGQGGKRIFLLLTPHSKEVEVPGLKCRVDFGGWTKDADGEPLLQDLRLLPSGNAKLTFKGVGPLKPGRHVEFRLEGKDYRLQLLSHAAIHRIAPTPDRIAFLFIEPAGSGD